MIFVFVFVITLYTKICKMRQYKICIVYLNELFIKLSFYTTLTYLVLYVGLSITFRLKVIYIENKKIKWKSVNSVLYTHKYFLLYCVKKCFKCTS